MELKEELADNTYQTDLELKQAAMSPTVSLKDEWGRKVRATAMGVSLFEYERVLRAIGVDYQ